MMGDYAEVDSLTIVASHSDCASAILVATLSNSFPISLMIATNFSL